MLTVLKLANDSRRHPADLSFEPENPGNQSGGISTLGVYRPADMTPVREFPRFFSSNLSSGVRSRLKPLTSAVSSLGLLRKSEVATTLKGMILSP
jgi:hypothetical protein